MPNLPPSEDFTDSSVTEAEFKTAITNLREYLASLLGVSGTISTALTTLRSMFNSTASKSTNYTVIEADRGKTIQCSATLELALTAAATLTNNFAFTVNNVGSGTVTINPSGTELIDGQSTKTIGGGQSAIIYCDGTSFYTVGMSAGGGFQNIQVFTSNGTFVVPAGTTACKVTVYGAGGGGGGANGAAAGVGNNNHNGGGGGSGGCSVEVVTGLTAGDTISVTVGAGGAGGVGIASGSTGGTSSFGSYCSATGGTGGGAASSTTPVPGSGGVGSNGNLNLRGLYGQALFCMNTYVGGAYTLQSACFGADAINTVGVGGLINVASWNGVAGVGYSSGGGGATGRSSFNINYTGGAGAGGLVIVEY